ncbi:MAG: hypothetical protein Q9187_006866, partial [Circinaria calcarea]
MEDKAERDESTRQRGKQRKAYLDARVTALKEEDKAVKTQETADTQAREVEDNDDCIVFRDAQGR